MTRAIAHIHWIVHAIAEKVIATNISTNTGYRIIRVDKAADSGVIIPALEIVQSRLRIVDIPAVAEGVEFAQRVGHGAGGGQRIAPRVIGISNHLRAAAVDQPGHVALRVLQIEVLRAIIGDGHGTNLIVGEVQGRIAGGCRNIYLRQRIAKVGIACPRSLARVDDLAAGIADVIDARLGAGADTLHQPAFRAYRIPM